MTVQKRMKCFQENVWYNIVLFCCILLRTLPLVALQKNIIIIIINLLIYVVLKVLLIMKPLILKQNIHTGCPKTNVRSSVLLTEERKFFWDTLYNCIIRFELLYSNALVEPNGLFRPNQYSQYGLADASHIVDHPASCHSLPIQKACVRSGLQYLLLSFVQK